MSSYENYYSQISIKCGIHGAFRVSVGEFIGQGRRCPECVVHGFKKHLPSFVYAILIQKGSQKYTGFGITNDITTRLSAHKRELSKQDFEFVESNYIECSGQIAKDIEAKIKQNFDCVSLGVGGFKREATFASYNTVFDFIKDLNGT